MLSKTPLLESADVSVHEVRCGGGRERWSESEPVQGWGVVLVRAGLFRRRVRDGEIVADPCTAYVQRPGTEQEVAHPDGHGDVCTSVHLAPGLAGTLMETGDDVPSGPAFVDSDIDLRHRLLLARAAGGADVFELGERAVRIVGDVLFRMAPHAPAARRPSTRAYRRELVDGARQELGRNVDLSLFGLAARLAVSPYHLSRVFHEVSGITVSRYRTRLRARRALERLAEGERDLAGLAAELGFADQSHLTKALHSETGLPPGVLRRRLSTCSASPDQISSPRIRASSAAALK